MRRLPLDRLPSILTNLTCCHRLPAHRSMLPSVGSRPSTKGYPLGKRCAATRSATRGPTACHRTNSPKPLSSASVMGDPFSVVSGSIEPHAPAYTGLRHCLSQNRDRDSRFTDLIPRPLLQPETI